LGDLLPWEPALYAAAGVVVLIIIYLILRLSTLFGGKIGQGLKLVSVGFLFFAAARSLQALKTMELSVVTSITSTAAGFRGLTELLYFIGLLFMAAGFYRFYTVYGKLP